MNQSPRDVRLHTLDEYTSFVGRQWRTIVIGTVIAMLVMGAVSYGIPKVYSASVIIDAGTLGRHRGGAVDTYRTGFNGGGYWEALRDVPAGSKVKTAWMDFQVPNVSIRVDAADGSAAADAAGRLGDYVVAALSKIPSYTPEELARPMSAGDTAALDDRVRRLDAWLRTVLAGFRARESRSMSERDRILGILKAGPRGRSAGQWSAMVRQLTSAIDDRERTIAGILQLEEALADLWRILAMLSPAADVHKILVVLDERPASPEEAARFVKTLTAISPSRNSAAAIDPPRVTVHPAIPRLPARPNRVLDVLIAGLFGLLGSTFVALLREGAAVQ